MVQKILIRTQFDLWVCPKIELPGQWVFENFRFDYILSPVPRIQTKTERTKLYSKACCTAAAVLGGARVKPSL